MPDAAVPVGIRAFDLWPAGSISFDPAVYFGGHPAGPKFAELLGTVEFEGNVTLTVWEDLDFVRGVIQGYSYSVSQGGERLYWYDPQPHPGDPLLVDTLPHHKHVPPDIKRHRVLAPGIAFDRPNLPQLIEEVERDVLN